MLSRGQKMKSSCPRGGGGVRTWSSIGGVRIFNGIAHSGWQILACHGTSVHCLSYAAIPIPTGD